MGARRAEGLAWRRVGWETVVLDLSRRRMCGLNPAGSDLWDRLVSGTEVKALTAGDPTALAFVVDLAARGLAEGLDVEGTGALGEVSVGAPLVEWEEGLEEVQQQFSPGLLPGQGGQCGARGRPNPGGPPPGSPPRSR